MFFKFIDLAIVDSTSVIFGTLDGSHFPDGIDGDIIVDYKGEEIQGSLQDLFIEKAEDRGIYNWCAWSKGMPRIRQHAAGSDRGGVQPLLRTGSAESLAVIEWLGLLTVMVQPQRLSMESY